MGMMDKVKFWKKSSDDFGDFSLDDFNLDKQPGAAGSGGQPHPFGADPGALGDLPPLENATVPGMQEGVPTRMETMQPSERSQQMSDQLGLSPQGQQSFSNPQPGMPARAFGQPAPQQQMQQAAPGGYRAPQEQFRQGPDIVEVSKELEIMHAKIDAIRSTLDSINQRLATIERIASGDNQQKRYTW
jgi:hypothetical protein